MPLAALIIGLACAVITILFVMQQFGTGAIGFLFSPIILTWLSFILGALASAASTPVACVSRCQACQLQIMALRKPEKWQWCSGHRQMRHTGGAKQCSLLRNSMKQLLCEARVARLCCSVGHM